MITLKQATVEDIVLFIETARTLDKAEVIQSSGAPIEFHIRTLVEKKPLGIWSGNDLLGIGGVEPDKENGAIGWMLLTTKVYDHKIEFLRWSKRYVKELLKKYRRIYNYVYILNFWHIDYLKWLGAKFIDTGVHNNYMLFTLERGCL